MKLHIMYIINKEYAKKSEIFQNEIDIKKVF